MLSIIDFVSFPSNFDINPAGWQWICFPSLTRYELLLHLLWDQKGTVMWMALASAAYSTTKRRNEMIQWSCFKYWHLLNIYVNILCTKPMHSVRVFTMSIYYVFKLWSSHQLSWGSCQSNPLCECMDICIHRACLLIAWFYVLSNIGANENSKYRPRPRTNQVNPIEDRLWELNPHCFSFISVLIMNSNL